ncbi:class I SAM-dependent methyltransferase [Pacificoceanicola onchidii]|uniref:class I SAM-dependent methyltransferase n=1 Tax=Pacificoceanicola onchidii TaxID=2562685 RepID=UPI0010A60F76|nr:class I SAM-dependent methyltransferase [Pacificoceanicola onchidii]
MSTFWNDRYATEGYVFGTAPAAFLPAHAGLIPFGASALCVADGEGRNAVWLAEQGCAVTAFDVSENALAKAASLAETREVSVDFHQNGIEDWDWNRQYDLVLGCFIQFVGPPEQATLLNNLKRAVAPGGRLMLHGYTPEQVALGTGGPGREENMYTEALLRQHFGDMNILRLATYEAHLNEGSGHKGRSALIDLIADNV